VNSSAKYKYAPCGELEARHAQALLDNGLDVAVLENVPSSISCSLHRDIHHGSGQVVGSNDLVGEQPKRRVDRAQQAIAEIWFPPPRHRVDVRGSEDVNAGKAPGEQRVLGLSLVAREGHPTSAVGSAPLTLKKANAASGLLPWRTRANSIV
jgi:hypothetical protein